MNKKNMKKIAEKNISLFEIFILVISILAFSYYIGNNFKFVSAAEGSDACIPETNTEFCARLGRVCDPYTSVDNCGTSRTARCGTCKGYTECEDGKCVSSDLSDQANQDANEQYQNSYRESSLDKVGAAVTNIVSPVVTTQLSEYAKEHLAGRANTQTPVTTPDGGTAAGGAGTAATGGGKFLTNLMGSVNVLLLNYAIAAGIYGIVWLARYIPGADPEMIDALALTLSLGYAGGATIYVVVNALGGGAVAGFWVTAGFGLIGLAIAGIAFIFLYQDERIDAVQFLCNPWQPANGGGPNGRDDCQQCNKGELPCTKYKCESLGLNCELVNEGTSDELCVWNNRNDITPPIISSWDDVLTEGFTYTPDDARLPPDKGVIITNTASADGCVSPFTRLTYGITLDKPGMCKVDTVRRDSFDKMTITIDQGYYLYNHTLVSFPTGVAGENATVGVSTGGTYETYVRCKSKNGYSNVGTFVFKYCVQNQPDTSAPIIELVNPSNNMPIQKGSISKLVDVYTNKPADCRWSHNDQSYNDMVETMSCSQDVRDINANMLYHCSGNLTGLKDAVENVFYFRCKSYPLNAEADRYANIESYKYVLIGTQDLVIDSIFPADGTLIKESAQSVKVTLDVKTSAGYKDGEAFCSYSDTTGTDRMYSLFANTGSYESTQELWLDEGGYIYTIKCCDLGGNCKTESTSFDVETDSNSPLVIRAYNDINQLKIITEETAECVYDTTSCSYTFEDGIKMNTIDNKEHSTAWNANSIFYIKCKDSFNNMPSPDECSLIARPVSSY
jgi:hypothetical protein